MNTSFLIAGGDLRFAALADVLAEDNSVWTAGFDRNVAMSRKVKAADSVSSIEERADCLILPLPASADGVTVSTPFSGKSISLESLSHAVKEGGIVLGGMISPEVKKFFAEKNIETADYAKREEFAVLNAVATAEGAVQVAMEETAATISGRKILILGAGRIAKVLIDVLSGFHTKITVAARKCSDLAWARVYGCESCPICDIDGILGDFDIIFNTVPAVVLDENRLKKISKKCLVIDLASKPGGVDFDTAGSLGVRTVWLLSLPGKVAPITSGRVIAETVENILRERGNCHG
ncbi:MAG: dipicolinate synthase subunit DpsA [Ruminococcus sp.]|nr:dipicolinate synthase subunit DpsA [Ruminococcus sp.]MCM1381041.1 dipicolinate synthase subunit DpsA [Muribaculaceae bacterium]MCM1479730.1 dipicolinate synthase subunit DpsA [Muribaculaceae bacterium]